MMWWGKGAIDWSLQKGSNDHWITSPSNIGLLGLIAANPLIQRSNPGSTKAWFGSFRTPFRMTLGRPGRGRKIEAPKLGSEHLEKSGRSEKPVCFSLNGWLITQISSHLPSVPPMFGCHRHFIILRCNLAVKTLWKPHERAAVLRTAIQASWRTHVIGHVLILDGYPQKNIGDEAHFSNLTLPSLPGIPFVDIDGIHIPHKKWRAKELREVRFLAKWTGPFLNHIHMDQSRHDAWPDVNDEFKTTLVMDGGPMRQGPVAKWDSAVETWSRFIMIQHDPSPGFIMNDHDSWG